MPYFALLAGIAVAIFITVQYLTELYLLWFARSQARVTGRLDADFLVLHALRGLGCTGERALLHEDCLDQWQRRPSR